jgi:cytochrome c-type biogenesis protein CcmF
VKISYSLQRALHLPRSTYGMTIAHLGMAVLVAGITGSTAWQTEKIQTMHIGDTVDVAGYALTLKNVEDGVKGPNYSAMRARFEVKKHEHVIAVLKPEKRFYETPPMPTTDAAIHTNLLGDIYAVIGDADGKGGYITRLYYNPLVPWIFIGAVFIAFGGAVSLSDRRHRIGAPVRSSAQHTAKA